MYTKDGWLTTKGVKYFFIIIFVSAILGALSSCNKAEEPVYYLYVTDYDEESVCVEIREMHDGKEVIICVLDRYLDSHLNSEKITKSLDTQVAFHTSLSASIAYWRLVNE